MVSIRDSPASNPLVPFVNAITDFEYAPAMIGGIEDNLDTKVKYPTLIQVGEFGTWVTSHWMDPYHYYHLKMTLTSSKATPEAH